MATSTAFYPGSFDPITNGHIDIATRALQLFDRVIVGVASSCNKNTLFTPAERLEMVSQVIEKIFAQQKQKVAEQKVVGQRIAGQKVAGQKVAGQRIVVIGFNSLLIESMREHDAKVILRGMRAVSDFEFEFQLASMNKALEPQIETVFLTASEKYHFLSSRFVREIALMGGDVSPFVHPIITQKLKQKALKQKSLAKKSLEKIARKKTSKVV